MEAVALLYQAYQFEAPVWTEACTYSESGMEVESGEPLEGFLRATLQEDKRFCSLTFQLAVSRV